MGFDCLQASATYQKPSVTSAYITVICHLYIFMCAHIYIYVQMISYVRLYIMSITRKQTGHRFSILTVTLQ